VDLGPPLECLAGIASGFSVVDGHVSVLGCSTGDMLVKHLPGDGMAVCNAVMVVAAISDAVGQETRELGLCDALATTRI